MTASNCRFRCSPGTLFLVMMVAVISAIVVVNYRDAYRRIAWQEFSPASVRQENLQGRDVLVSFTADWDLMTMYQHIIIDTPDVRRFLEIRDISPMQADYSSGSLTIKNELQSLGLISIPALVLYPASGQRPIVLSQGSSTVEQVKERISQRAAAPEK